MTYAFTYKEISFASGWDVGLGLDFVLEARTWQNLVEFGRI